MSNLSPRKQQRYRIADVGGEWGGLEAPRAAQEKKPATPRLRIPNLETVTPIPTRPARPWVRLHPARSKVSIVPNRMHCL